MKWKLFTGLALVSVLMAEPVFSLEVDREVLPRITLGGRVIATPSNTNKIGFEDNADESSDEIDIADSGLLLRFDKRLYGGGIAGAVFGLTKPDEDADLSDEIYFHQFNTFFYNEDFHVSLGRTRLRNTLVEFPTIRDDDLVEYTHVGNANSFAENDQYQLFGSLASLDWYITGKSLAFSAWVGSRVETDSSGERVPAERYNTGGLGLTYEKSEDLLYFEWIRHAGILIDYQNVEDGKVDSNGKTENALMLSVVAGIEFNLNMNPAQNWSMAIQLIQNQGVEDAELPSVVSENTESEEIGESEETSLEAGLARAEYSAGVISLRYTGRPRLLTRYQGAISFAYKSYPDSSDATQYTITPSMVYRLGQGVDFVTQVSWTSYGDDLASLTGFESETQIQAGLVFYFDTVFNDQIGERDSILNLEHGYIE